MGGMGIGECLGGGIVDRMCVREGSCGCIVGAVRLAADRCDRVVGGLGILKGPQCGIVGRLCVGECPRGRIMRGGLILFRLLRITIGGQCGVMGRIGGCLGLLAREIGIVGGLLRGGQCIRQKVS